MSDGERSGKQVLLKAEVPEGVAKELDRLAEELNFSTRAGLLRHIVIDFIKGPKTTTFSDFERMDTGQGFRGQPHQDVDMSELTAVLHTLNKSMDQSAAQINIIARQNETIHQLVDQNDKLTQTTLWGNERPALPEPSQNIQEQTQTVEEVAEVRTEPIQKSPEPVRTQTEEPTKAEPMTQDKQPLPGGDVLEVPQAVELGKSLGSSFGNDTVRRAVKAGVLVALPGRPMKLRSEDIRAFALEYAKVGELPKMPQIRDGKVI